MSRRLAPTRLNLIHVRRQARRAAQGLGLLKDKREALMRAFLSHVSERVQYHDLMEQ